MKKLKQCPFCGKQPQWRLGKKKHCQLHGELLQDYVLTCVNPKCTVNPSITGSGKSWMIDGWNTRNHTKGE